MIEVYLPNSYIPERRYIVQTIMVEFLGLEFITTIHEKDVVRISLTGGKDILLPDTFFSVHRSKWLHPDSLPKTPLHCWDVPDSLGPVNLTDRSLPVLYGEAPDRDDFLQVREDAIKIGLDVFGAAFFMLTRYEEVVTSERDRHKRFPIQEAIAYQEDFLDRPLVNEYAEVLWACMRKLCPRLTRRKQEFRVLPTHDVDIPFAYFRRPVRSILRSIGTDIFRQRSLGNGLEKCVGWLRTVQAGPQADPYNTFDWLMGLSEAAGVRSAFFLLAGQSGKAIDGDYSLYQPHMRALLSRIHERGHEIGLHGSYYSYNRPSRLMQEAAELQATCEALCIVQQEWGGRQHFLRWETPATFAGLERAGLNYDTSLGFPERPGFRCGTCYEYTAYDLVQRRPLDLKERPLIVMECSVLDKQYLGLGQTEKAMSTMLSMKGICKKFAGNFVLLWHNSRLQTEWDRHAYQTVLTG